jgi:hypothetical protein
VFDVLALCAFAISAFGAVLWLISKMDDDFRARHLRWRDHEDFLP